jgi:hypothetical protein
VKHPKFDAASYWALCRLPPKVRGSRRNDAPPLTGTVRGAVGHFGTSRSLIAAGG